MLRINSNQLSSDRDTFGVKETYAFAAFGANEQSRKTLLNVELWIRLL